jgi:protein-S-isoprenylcysteine O-methyltransferase Ste14
MPETLSHATSRPAEDVSVSSNSKLAGATREPQLQVAQQAVHGTEARVWWSGLFFGVATQVFFLWTAWHLFLFLRDGAFGHSAFAPWLDTLLAFLFIAPHSVLLFPKVQSVLRRWLPSAWLGCLHCVATCISLWLLFRFWTASSNTLWDLQGIARSAMLLAFYGSWIGLLYSLWITGMGYQTGLTPWWYWLRGQKPPRREFRESGAFRWMRHPVYLSFLGLIWFTPRMTLDHGILTAAWTFYIYLGSYWKDRRMIHYLGDSYRDYARRVTGFPVIGFGPWGRMR